MLDFNVLVCRVYTMQLKYLHPLLWKILSILFNAFHTMASAARMPFLHVMKPGLSQRGMRLQCHMSLLAKSLRPTVVSLNWSSILPNTSSVKEGGGRIDDS